MAENIGVQLTANMDVSHVLGAVQQIQSSLKGLKIPDGIGDNLKKNLSTASDLLKKYQSQLEKGVSGKSDAKAISKTSSEIEKVLSKVESDIQQLNNKQIYLKADLAPLNELKSHIQEVRAEYEKAIREFSKSSGVSSAFESMRSATSRSGLTQVSLNKAENAFNKGDLDAYMKALDEVQMRISKLSENTVKRTAGGLLGIDEKEIASKAAALDLIKNRIEELKKIDPNSQGAIKALADNVTKLSAEFDKLNTEKLNQGAQATTAMGNAAANAASGFRAVSQEADKFVQSTLSAAKQVEQLQQSTQYFFSLRNMINLLKRGIDQAVESVKELDAAMTETAVVTDFSVSDMWEKLPEYTANANALGASVKDMYEATTLYYQQGLNTNQAMSIATETMKMARIGGLEAADATDKMTAALRGFNMEINEASAQRVNDVYSNLAAKTASNTEELGTAMQRTASIAASAGMSFEGTAAFLAQAIETTREPAENLGTAMKTIVARFTELKKNPLEMVEVDGEEVSYNKVDTALQSIGVSLKDANGQFRDLDQVFLDISARWDGLTQTQQRYIATTAAGSRQQSRFIAMMSNYNRTLQLMDYAQNSAGASQEQFDKTLEGLDAKLTRLQNAWQRFTMGIADNTIIKGAVDGLTSLVDGVNNLLSTLSFGSSKLKSVLSILTAFTGLKMAGRFANSMIGGLGGLIDPKSTFKQGFLGGATGARQAANLAQAHAISNPIVSAINAQTAALGGKLTTVGAEAQKASTYKDFSKAQDEFRTLFKKEGGFTMGEALGSLKGLSSEHQRAVLQSSPEMKSRISRGLGDYVNNLGLDAQGTAVGMQVKKAVIQGMAKGDIKPEEVQKVMHPTQWGKIVGPEMAKSAITSYANNIKTQLQANDAQIRAAAQEQFIQARAEYPHVNEDELYRQIYNQNRKQFFDTQIKGKEPDLGGTLSASTTKAEKLASVFGGLGSTVTATGQAFFSFGMILNNLGLEGAGAAFMSLGNIISSVGMTVANLGSVLPGIVTKIKEAGGVMKALQAESAAMGLGGLLPGLGIAAGLFAIVGIVTAIGNKIQKNVKENAKKVKETFNDTINETKEKINSLESYKTSFDRLSRGIDQYGRNIGLTNEEYEEYLEISEALAKTSPSLIRGYDAQGHAIIAQGDAINEVIKKQKDLQKEARKEYTSDVSMNKILSGIRLSDAYKDALKTAKWQEDQGISTGLFGKQARDVQSAFNKLDASTLKSVNEELTKLTGTKIDVSNLDDNSIRALGEHYSDAIGVIEESNTDLAEGTKSAIENSLTDLGEGYADLMKEVQPLTEQLQQYLSLKGLDAIGLNIGEEFTAGFNAGLQDLSIEALAKGWSAEKLKQEAEAYGTEFKKLTSDGSAYAQIMDKVNEKQDKYIDNISDTNALDNYKSSIEDEAQELDNLADRFENGTAAQRQFAEMCRQAAADARTFAETGVKDLGAALNTLSDEFTSARDAQNRFQEATKSGDYYTAAEGFKSIAEAVLDEKNAAGNGSLTAWKGAEEILGAKYIDTHSWEEITNQVGKLNNMFQDGLPGVQAFGDYLVEMAQKVDLSELGKINDAGQFEFDFDFKEDELADFAEKLNMSEDALAALIDKSRQFVPWDVSKPEEVVAALRSGEQSMIGQGGKLYTSESAFRETARQHEIVGENYTTTKENVEAQGVKFLTVDNLVTKNDKGQVEANNVLKDIGISQAQGNNTLNNAVAAFAKMGFSLEDTQKILTTDGIKLKEGEVTEDQVAEAYQEEAFAVENPTVAGIANDTGVIANAATAMLASMGIISDNLQQDIDKATDQKNIEKDLQDFDKQTGEASTSKEHEAARQTLENKIADYDNTISLLQQGLANTEEGSAQYNKLNSNIEALTQARNQLSDKLTEDSKTWDNKMKAIADTFNKMDIGDADKNYLKANAVDFDTALNNTNLQEGANQLRALAEEGNLSQSTMAALGQEFTNLNAASLRHLTDSEVDALYTKIGLTAEESKVLRAQLFEPFQFQTQLTGENLETYINNIDFLTQDQKTLLLNAEVTGEEKVSTLLGEINQEFGGGSEETKKVILEAEAKMAAGDRSGAEQLLKDAGFDENQVKEITQKLSITVDGSIANKGEVQEALNKEVSNLKLTSKAKIDLKAKVNIDKQALQQSQNGGTVKYKSTVDPSGINQAKNTAKQGADMPIKAVDKATPTINSIKSNASQSVSFNVSPNFTGTWTKTLTINTQRTGSTGPSKRGRKVAIPAHQTLSFGAAARGFNAPQGNTKRKVTGLVGEEGFEIGYIPSEARSVIFGANGPEMATFPSDTVIFPHGESKDIIRRGKKGIPTFGSFDSGKSGGIPTTGGSSSGGNDSNVVRNTSQAVTDAAEEAEKVIQKAGTVVVWWLNLARRTEAIQRKVDKNQKTYEKYLKKLTATLHGTGTEGGGDAYISSLRQSIAVNQEALDRANRELKVLNQGSTSTAQNSTVNAAQNKVNAAQNKLNKAKTAKQKATAKKELEAAKKNLTKAKKNALNATKNDVDAGGSVADISYEVTKKKKGKETKETKEERVDLGGYINWDAASGTYVINQDAINKVAKTNGSKAKAIRDAAEDEINKRLQRKYEAEDAIAKAQEALEQLSEQLYETFFGWETALTRIWNITQKLEAAESGKTRTESFQDMLEAQLNSGKVDFANEDVRKKFMGKYTDNFKRTLEMQTQVISDRMDAIEQSKKDVQDALTSADEQKKIDAARSILGQDQAIKDAAARLGAAQSELSAAYGRVNSAASAQASAQARINAANSIIQSTGKTLNNKKASSSAKKKARDQRYTAFIERDAAQAALAKANADRMVAEASIAGYQAQVNAAQNAYTALKNNTRELTETEKLAYEEQVKRLEEQKKVEQDARNRYMKVKTLSDGTVVVDFNTELLEMDQENGLITQDHAKKIEDYVNKVIETSKTLGDNYEALTQELTNMYNSLAELKDEWAGYGEELKKIQEDASRKEIDALKRLYDAIANALKELLDKVKKSLDARRQTEDNAKVEQDIAKKQQRLAMLQASSSGTNAVEIAQLEQEIANAQQSYERTLEDQLLAKLQEQGDEAAAQRQRQIELLEAGVESINNIEDVNRWMANPIQYYDELHELYLQSKDWDNLTDAEREKVEIDWTTFFNGLATNQERQEEASGKIDALSALTTQSGTTDAIEAVKKSVEALDEQLKAREEIDALAKQTTLQAQQEAVATAQKVAAAQETARNETAAANAAKAQAQAAEYNARVAVGNSPSAVAKTKYADAIRVAHKSKTITAAQLKDIVAMASQAGYSMSKVGSDLAAKDGSGGVTWVEVVRAAKKAGYSKSNVTKWWTSKTAKNAIKNWSQYATGGLADYTGPAWLDGTPSRPELVLNAQDTKNFLALKDVLAHAMGSIDSTSAGYGDMSYEININVDKISNDYDVDKMADRIKKIIVKDSSYRNVTQVRNLR